MNGAGGSFLGTDLMTWLNVVIAACALFWAVTGKGSVYKNDYVKKEYAETYRRAMRIFLLAVGVLCGVMAALDFLVTGAMIVKMSLIGAALVMIVAFVVITRPMLETRRRK